MNINKQVYPIALITDCLKNRRKIITIKYALNHLLIQIHLFGVKELLFPSPNFIPTTNTIKQSKMSKNVENFEEFLKNLNEELEAVCQQHPNDDGENDDCADFSDKLNIFSRYMMELIDSGLCDDVEIESTPSQSMCTDGNTKIQSDLNKVRICLENHIQLADHAIDSLLEGKNGT